MTWTACIDCGVPTERTRCDECRPAHAKLTRQGRPDRKGSARKRGYDTHWDMLSRRARALQPWCHDCGATEDLEADHSTEAWERKAAGLPLRLADIEVVCGPCNRARGRQRPNQDPRGATPGPPEGDPPWPQAKFSSHMVGSPAGGGGDP